jgi:uncharacterized repeat protein (TIGR01451 family)
MRMEAGQLGVRQAIGATVRGFALLALAFLAGPAAGAGSSGALRLEVIAAPNFVVDSNTGTPSSQSPHGAYLGVRIWNDGTVDLTNVVVNIGNYNGGTNATPGTYPSRTHSGLSGTFSLTHEGGAAGAADATRYLGTIKAGEYAPVYWLVSYPLQDAAGTPVFGAPTDLSDDLWLKYDVWGTAQAAGTSLTAEQTGTATMRREISASSNKIYPNTANQVPLEYRKLLERYEPAWTNIAADGSVGTRIVAEGVWYELGNVGNGFDMNGDLVPDRDAWLQPVGNPSVFDAGSFRLAKTHVLLVVKLQGGGEQLIVTDDQLYFTGIPDNVGVVGYVRYEFVPLRSGGTAQLTPYQEAASGFNEKFNADYGATLGAPFQSLPSSASLAKAASLATASPGQTIGYQMAFTNTGQAAMGDPTNGMPVVVEDRIPTGAVYVAGSAAASNVPPPGLAAYTVLYSTNNGASWQATEPVPAASVTDIQWWLNGVLQPGAAGLVRFTVQVASNYAAGPLLVNTSGLCIGNTPPFTNASASTFILGVNSITNTVFLDTGVGAGTLGNGVQDGTEPGLSNVLAYLYYDANTNGVVDAGDLLVSSAAARTNGLCVFTNLMDGRYVVVVLPADAAIPTGYTITTPGAQAVNLDAAHATTSSVTAATAFGFAPALSLTKSLASTGPVYEGRTVTYRIAVTNNLPGDGVGGGMPYTYTVWATNLDAARPPDTGWNTPTNAYGAPDNQSATDFFSKNPTDILSLNGCNLPSDGGTVSNVILRIPIVIVAPLKSGNTVTFSLITKGGSPIFTTNYAGNTLSSGTMEFDVTASRAWTWNDFATNAVTIQIAGTKSGGAPGGSLGVDAAGFRVTSTATFGGGAGTTTLDPVPLTDTFDVTRLRYVSASPAPTRVTTNGTTGSIFWENLGPIYPAGGRDLLVTFKGLEPPNNTATVATNTASVTNATFLNGRPANPSVSQAVTNLLPTGTIGQYVWRDVNRNGLVESNETRLAGVHVVLTPPAGVDVGAGAGVAITNTTDTNGFYLFEGIAATGRYVVAVLTSTLPNRGVGISNVWTEMNGSVNPTNVTVVTDLLPTATDGADDHLTANFGYDWGGSMIAGQVWNDINRSGTPAMDPGEYALTNLTVYLYASTDLSVALATNRTDAAGGFAFIGNYIGTYVVVVTNLTGPLAAGSWTNTFDTDGAATASRATVNVTSGATVRVDYSYAQTGPYAIGRLLYYDWIGNGTNDLNDEGIAGIPVALYWDANSNGVVDAGIDVLMATTNTSVQGLYTFTNLPAGNYLVLVDQSAAGFPPLAICTADPHGAKDGFSAVTVTSANRFDQNFGFQPYGTGQIGDTVWRDLNADGAQFGPQETGITNVVVRLYADMNGDTNYVLLATTNTDASGTYLFPALPDGAYLVAVDTASPFLPKDAFNARYTPTTPTNRTVTLSGGGSWLAADFGFTAPGAIGDTIYWDNNANGTQDGFERGITNVTVNLYVDVNQNKLFDSTTDTWAAVRTTDTNGNYLFTGVTSGWYVVVVSTNSGPVTNATLTAAPGLDGQPLTNAALRPSYLQYSVHVQPGDALLGVDFGFQPPGVIGETVWIDSNGNHVRDDTELGIGNITLVLSNASYAVTNQTDIDGYYAFGGTPDGAYWLRVVTTNDVFASLRPSYDADLTNTANFVTLGITNGHVVAVGGVARTNFDLLVNFGYQYTGTNRLSGTVGLDGAPQNGVLGTGPSGVSTDEVAYVNQTVFLSVWRDANSNSAMDTGEITLIGSAQTATNGDYAFTDLPVQIGPGTNRYVVSLTAPFAHLMLTTTNGATPALSVVQATNVMGETLSAYQVVAIAAAVTNIDFAFRDTWLYDFGDLPSSYSTRLADAPAGAQHRVLTTPDLYLGNGIGTEKDGQPSATASLDTYDDGVTPLGIWQTGTNGAQVQVRVGRGSGYLVGFIDFNRNGSFADTNDLVVTQAVSSVGGSGGTGVYTFAVNVPAGGIVASNVTTLYARFRLFPETPVIPALAFAGLADDGEVEDYRWDLGYVAGTIWMDSNTNNLVDAGEARLAGTRVYIDANSNRVWDAGEVFCLADANGAYAFSGLNAGSYLVAVETNGALAGLGPSYDPDGTRDARTLVTLAAGASATNQNFGFVAARVYGYAYGDRNGNLMFNAGDIPLSNVPVRLLLNGTQLVATVTSASGLYQFTGLVSGAYTVVFGIKTDAVSLAKVERVPTPGDAAYTDPNRNKASVSNTTVYASVAVAPGSGVLAGVGEPTNIGFVPGTTAAAVLIQAYATADGVIVEFEAIEEAGTNDMILYLLRDGQWIEVGRCAAVGEGNNRYRFLVPGLAAGDLCNLLVRDDEGQYHTAYNVRVGNFATQEVLMDKNGLWLSWASLPDRTYEIYRAERLDGEWTLVKTVTASAAQSRAFVSFAPDASAGFYKIVLR